MVNKRYFLAADPVTFYRFRYKKTNPHINFLYLYLFFFHTTLKTFKLLKFITLKLKSSKTLKL